MSGPFEWRIQDIERTANRAEDRLHELDDAIAAQLVLSALGDIAGTSSSTRIRRVANEALKATRARRKA